MATDLTLSTLWTKSQVHNLPLCMQRSTAIDLLWEAFMEGRAYHVVHCKYEKSIGCVFETILNKEHSVFKPSACLN